MTCWFIICGTNVKSVSREVILSHNQHFCQEVEAAISLLAKRLLYIFYK